MQGKKISIIGPAYNEANIIGDFIKSVLKIIDKGDEIIIVDDNSPDGTWKKVQSFSKRDKRVRLLNRINKRGLASAIRDGAKLARGNVLLWMDVDMDTAIIPKLVAEIGKYDVAIASRYVKNGKDDREFFRVALSYILNFIASLLLDPTVRDYTTGYVATKRRVYNKIHFTEKGYGEYCIEFLYLAKKYGYKIKEVPYVCSLRKSGETKTTPNLLALLRHIAIYLGTVLKLSLNLNNSIR